MLVFGNGGSAADAQHFVAELVGRFERDRKPISAICLNCNASVITAIGNDYGFDQIFSRQVSAMAAPGDVVLGISTSGNSQNVLRAFAVALSRDVFSVGLLGCNGGSIGVYPDKSIIVPSDRTATIQEAHGLILHVWAEMIESICRQG